MEREWRCRQCNSLLGLVRAPRVFVRQRQAQYIVDGDSYSILGVCRKCATANEVRRGDDDFSSAGNDQ